MKIDLTNIPLEGKKAAFRLGLDWWKPDTDEDRILKLESPVDVRIKLYPAGNRIAVEGDFSVTLLLKCDRCLEPYTWDLSKDFKLYLSMIPFKGDADIELAGDDLDLDFIKDNFLDSDQIIKEQLILNVPLKTLCRPKCKGICPLCGFNLNIVECSCSSRYNTSNNQK